MICKARIERYKRENEVDLNVTTALKESIRKDYVVLVVTNEII